MVFKMKGYSAFTKNGKPVGRKKIHQEKGFFGGTHEFTKGARTSTGTYTPSDVTVEKGKKTTYVQQGDTYNKVVQQQKKGEAYGASTWKTKRSKNISSKKAERQIKRRLKKYSK